MATELSEQEQVRRQNLQAIRDLGINPYPAAEYPTDAFSTEIVEEFEKTEGQEGVEPRQVCIAGRMMSRRIMGKASFIELKDSKPHNLITAQDIFIAPENFRSTESRIYSLS